MAPAAPVLPAALAARPGLSRAVAPGLARQRAARERWPGHWHAAQAAAVAHGPVPGRRTGAPGLAQSVEQGRGRVWARVPAPARTAAPAREAPASGPLERRTAHRRWAAAAQRCPRGLRAR